KHSCLCHHNHYCLHHFTISAEGWIRPVATLTPHKRIFYFKTTISTSPSRRSTSTPQSPSSCLVSRRSTRASATFKSRIVNCGRNGGKSGFENTSFRSGAEMLKPRHASSKRNTAPDAHACGAQAT